MLPAQRDEIIIIQSLVEVIRQRRDVMDRQPSGLDATSLSAHATAMIVSPHDRSGFLAPHLCISEPIRPRISLLDLWSHTSTFVNTTTNCAISLDHVSPVSDVADAVTDVALPYIYFFIIVKFKINKNIYKKLKPSVTSVTPIVKWLYKPLQVFSDI